MKTTIDIADALLVEVRQLAQREGVTVRSLVERGLRAVIAESAVKETHPFRLRDASVGGDGLHPDLEEGDWERIRELAYEGRGG